MAKWSMKFEAKKGLHEEANTNGIWKRGARLLRMR